MSREAHTRTDSLDRDRRATSRYPISADLEYRLIRHKKIVQTGSGRTVNFSSTGLLFESARPLLPGMRIEVTVVWPARLHDVSLLNLCINGKTVRTSGKLTAVRIMSYDFRTSAVVEQARTAETPHFKAGTAGRY
jgi:hypothetical protein